MATLREQVAAAIKEAHAKAAQAADWALSQQSTANEALKVAELAVRDAQRTEAAARAAMTACDNAVALLAQLPASGGPDPAPQPPSPPVTPTPTNPGVPPTPPGPITPAVIDALHFENFLAWFSVPDPALQDDPDPGRHKHLLAWRYANLPALPGGWQSRMEGKILQGPFAGNFGRLANWKQEGDALLPFTSPEDFAAQLRMAVAANKGLRSNRTP